ncbi:lysozyme inhibitor LprI family protein [Fulvimarina sp. 2208YS6-2-32]|uniref:Lysozyme inhibitor LprI family protein n=1 Tax=Fulvimarina uroteuthidis TaxID=3098149 RepID=A0ABU5I0W6_9HYPH|nr:lysozyme inhibitor LprI family protein [Fulvimarina sp. 2208YS6-2-32]MDY8109034.1 lysozyme inhibitor LprI family protein [Fulvimarina sp. 2208YS6-2-32]
MRSLVRLGVLGLGLGLGTGAAMAQDGPDCDDPQTQLDMTICSAEAAGRLDERLNTLWDEASRIARERQGELRADAYNPLSEDDDGPWDALLKAQRGWIAYKDNHCALTGLQFYGGSMRPQVENDCLAGLTAARIAELEAFINPEP